LLIGAVSDEPNLARVGAAVLVVAMLVALLVHLRARDPLTQIAPAAVLGVLAVVTVVVAAQARCIGRLAVAASPCQTVTPAASRDLV
jgi:DoxX-like family